MLVGARFQGVKWAWLMAGVAVAGCRPASTVTSDAPVGQLVLLAFAATDESALQPCDLVWSEPLGTAPHTVSAPSDRILVAVEVPVAETLRAARAGEEAIMPSWIGTVSIDGGRATLRARTDLRLPRLAAGEVEPNAECTACGSGALDAFKACDDGATRAGDGCSARCELEAGWSCTGEPSTCAASCGDGVRAGTEGCDDANDARGDGCDACAEEPGWTCRRGAPEICTRTEIAAGARTSCLLKSDGTIACWGFALEEAPPPGRFVAIAVGERYGCALDAEGAVSCWGATTAPAGRFRSISAARDHGCGVLLSGEVLCWGESRTGRSDSAEGLFESVSAGYRANCGIRAGGGAYCFDDRPDLIRPYDQISAGDDHVCGLMRDGTAECWGNDLDGRTRAPAAKLRWIAAGGSHSCGLRPEGAVVCWGGGVTAPGGVQRFRSISAGLDHSCGIRDDGQVVCWGEPWHEDVEVPAGRFTAVEVSQLRGKNALACGLRENGDALCWGRGSLGKDGTVTSSDAVALAVGHGRACAVRADNTVECTATIQNGPPAPKEAQNLRWTELALGAVHFCGVVRDEQEGVVQWLLICDGSEALGRVPDRSIRGTSASADRTCGLLDGDAVCWMPTGHVTTTGPFTAVRTGSGFACALGTNQAITCWDRADLAPPTGAFTGLTTGSDHACAIAADQSARCWGKLDGAPPIGARFVDLGAGGDRSCGVTTDGTIACWPGRAGPFPP